MIEILHERFQLQEFRPGQRDVIEALVREKAALAVFPTGGGKSLCYQLPALMFEGVTLVVSPLIALMKDQIDFLQRKGIKAERIDSSLGEDAWQQVMGKLRAGELSLLYVAPERFNNERFRAALMGVKIALFAVDEAHCISQWGHNFRPDYLKLARAAKEMKAERVLALTATATPAVVEDICAGFSIPKSAAIVTGFYRENLHIAVHETTLAAREEALVERLRARPGARIVYVTLQQTAEDVARLLASRGVDARAYHAGMETEERTSVQEWWMAGSDRVVVATIAFGMGIDKADVRGVFHFNLPKSIESYSQEIGRAGRDGAVSNVELFVCEDDIATLREFATRDTPTLAQLTSFFDAVFAPDTDPVVLNLHSLGRAHGVKPLIARTALVYLELAGIVEERTPVFGKVELKPLVPLKDISAGFDGERRSFVDSLFAAMKKGRIWLSFDPEALAKSVSQPRERVLKAIEYMVDKGQLEARRSDIRHRFTLLQRPALEPLVADMATRFKARERAELDRIAQMLALARSKRCIANALSSHFGEDHATTCAHCSACLTAV